MKGLINIQKNDNKCLFWCHIRHLNSLEIHAKKDQKEIKTWLTILKNHVYINLFCYVLVYPVYISNKKLRNCIDLLLITDGNE